MWGISPYLGRFGGILLFSKAFKFIFVVKQSDMAVCSYQSAMLEIFPNWGPRSSVPTRHPQPTRSQHGNQSPRVVRNNAIHAPLDHFRYKFWVKGGF